MPTHRCCAQSLAGALAQRLSLAALVTRAPVLPFMWPHRFADRFDPAPTPLFASIGEFLRQAREETRAHGFAADMTLWAPGAATNRWRNLAENSTRERPVEEQRRNSVAEQRPDLQDGATGEGSVVRFIHYRLPWLVTPEAAIPGLPTVSVRTSEAISFELMGGAIGGRSGAYGQMVLRF